MNIILDKVTYVREYCDNKHGVCNIRQQRMFKPCKGMNECGWWDWYYVSQFEGDLKRSLMQSYWMSCSVADVGARPYPLSTHHPDSSLLQAPATFCLRTYWSPAECLAHVQARELTPLSVTISERGTFMALYPSFLIPPRRVLCLLSCFPCHSPPPALSEEASQINCSLIPSLGSGSWESRTQDMENYGLGSKR